MLSGYINGCYGITELELKTIDFLECSRAVIYAPNGVMKTSFAKTLEALANGKPPEENMFVQPPDYHLRYHSQELSAGEENQSLNVHVVHSFEDHLEWDSVSTLLVNRHLKQEYDKIQRLIKEELDKFTESLRVMSGLSRNKLKDILFADFGLSSENDWVDLIRVIGKELETHRIVEELREIEYKDLINDKTMILLKNPDFQRNIGEYLQILNELISQSEVLSTAFDDHNASELGKSFSKHNLFEANHRIVLRNGRAVENIKQWNLEVSAALEQVNDSPELRNVYSRINGLINRNIECQTLKRLLNSNHGLIRHLGDVDRLKKTLWLNYIVTDYTVFQVLKEKVEEYRRRIDEIYEAACSESDLWTSMISNFHSRFSVPFRMVVGNQPNVILRDEPASIEFEYYGHDSQRKQTQEDLMAVLSAGERRALYLLNILFDLEIIKTKAERSGSKFLIVFDDIADSFDYKNKYAIVEYLKEISEHPYIDVLILTHNFDFYRTVVHRLGIRRDNCFMVQKDNVGRLVMSKFGYRDDALSYGIQQIRDGDIDRNETRLKWLIACIPFFRNLAHYKGDKDLYSSFTSLLHLKDDTHSVTVKDLWDYYGQIFPVEPLISSRERQLVIDLIRELALVILNEAVESIKLESKIVLAIAIRLEAEIFMENKYKECNLELPICSKNQTRVWYESIKDHLSNDERTLLERVNIMTPETIHLNAFMYEPIIDISDWHLKGVFSELKVLNEPQSSKTKSVGVNRGEQIVG